MRKGKRTRKRGGDFRAALEREARGRVVGKKMGFGCFFFFAKGGEGSELNLRRDSRKEKSCRKGNKRQARGEGSRTRWRRLGGEERNAGAKEGKTT